MTSNQNVIEEMEIRFQEFLRSLVNEASYSLDFIPTPLLHDLKGLDLFIQENIKRTVKLDDLAAVSHINKFGFSRAFKKTTGLSPLNYVHMRKVFDAKEHIRKNTNLTHLAYDYNFVDLAHFSKFFKRFVGVSPQVYRENFSF